MSWDRELFLPQYIVPRNDWKGWTETLTFDRIIVVNASKSVDEWPLINCNVKANIEVKFSLLLSICQLAAIKQKLGRS